MITQIRFRRGTTQEWAQYNPVLAEGEPGVDTTLDRFKIGDGASAWIDLAFQSYSLEELDSRLASIDVVVDAAEAASSAAAAAALDAQEAADAAAAAAAALGSTSSVNDTVIAASVNNTTSATRTGLNAAYARKRAEDIRNISGMVYDGSPTSPAVLQAALNAQTGPLALGAGVVLLTGGIDVVSGMELEVARGAKILKGYNGGSGTGGAIFRNPTYTTKVNDVKITGEGIIAASGTFDGGIVSIYGDRTVLQGWTCNKWQGSRAIVIDGDDVKCHRLDVFGSPNATNNGGLRVTGGKRFSGSNLRIISGDDALQFVPVGNPADSLFNHSIEDGVYENCTFESTAARGMVVAIANSAGDATVNMTANVLNVHFTDCFGIGGAAAVVITNDNSSGRVDGVYFNGGATDMLNSQGTMITSEIFIRRGGAGVGALRNVVFDKHDIRNPRGITAHTLGQPSEIFFVNMDGVRSSLVPTAPIMDLTGTDVQIIGGTYDGKNTGANVIEFANASGGDAPVRPVVRDAKVIDIADGFYGIQATNTTQPTIRDTQFVEHTGATTARAFRYTSSVTNGSARNNDLTQISAASKFTNAGTGTSDIRNNRPVVDATAVAPVTVLQTTDSAPVNNSTVQVTSTALTMSLEANSTYTFSGIIFYDASTAGDLKAAWAIPTGATGKWSSDAPASNVSIVTAATANRAQHDITTGSASCGGAGVATIGTMKPQGYITTTTAGTFAFRYAQLVADPTDLTIRAGSYITATKIA